MPAVGAKPKPEGTTRHRVPPVHEWIDVQEVPYSGPVPSIGRVPARTRRWWSVVTKMPHCVMWDDADWQFAVDTALVHAAFSKGDMGRASELRLRERLMGTTWDARRDLRIKYVPVGQEQPEKAPTAIDEYRARLG